MTAVKTAGLTKKYDTKTAVNELSLEIEEGEFYSLLGVNGAGKTTTIKMLTTLTSPTSGEAYIMGHSIREKEEEIKKLMNVSPQETAIAPNLTTFENLIFIAGIYGVDKKTAQKNADEIIKLLGLDEIRRTKAAVLSGGFKRRLSIAMALITSPRVLFLDEPTLGLDVIARRELWSVISNLKGKITIILTTHYLEEACALSDRIGIMSHGMLRAQGTEKELIQLSGKENFEDAFIYLAAGEGN